MSQTIIVTGASAGIGLATTTSLLSFPHRHRVIACCRSNDSPLKSLASLPENKDRLFIVRGDVAERGFVETVFAQGLMHFGIERVDGVVLNHGTLGRCERIADCGWEEWEAVMRVNVGSFVEMIRHLIPYLRESQGRIIMTSSGAAETAYTSWGAYGASKAAINHLAKTLAKEEKTITTIALRPGMVDTNMQSEIRSKFVKNMDEDDQQKFLGAHRDGKLVPPEKVGNVMAGLVTGAERELSGLFISWNDERLKGYQG